MLRPLEQNSNLGLPKAVCCEIERIVKEQISEDELSKFILDLLKDELKNKDDTSISVVELCDYFIQHNIGYLRPSLVKLSLQTNPTKMIALCRTYVESSGLALFLLTQLESNLKPEQKFELLKKAAALGSANAMELLYLDYFPKSGLNNNNSFSITQKEAMNYLNEAARLGCRFANHELHKIHMGFGPIRKK